MWKKYWYNDAEKKHQRFWDEEWIYNYDPSSEKPIYSIDTPPPTISGKIHIWHIFSYTQAEVIARYKRMTWNELFYPFGFDDNWLPTERLVEWEIGKKWSEMMREEFNKECLRVSSNYREKFKDLWKSVWISADWNLEYSTVSPEVQKVSQISFLNLLDKWVAYKKKFPSLWCSECQTSVAQAEVDDKEENSVFYDIRFTLENNEDLIIATTRPELLPACVAVFVHPEDERYQHMIWNKVTTPLGATVDIIWDDKVAKDKWTWVVMCCTYWDETDHYWVKKHNLEEKVILDENGHITNTDIEWLNGAYYKKARKLIIANLKEKSAVLKETPIEHSVWVHERCGTKLEIIPTSQWFIKLLDKKEEFIKAADEINWYPEYMKKRYIEWVENLKWDWAISRRRFFWVPIPVWYSKKTGEMILPSKDQLPLDPLTDKPANLPKWHTYDDIVPETDVLDTWATSSLTPLVNAWWDGENFNNERVFPIDLRPQAHDIIRTWAFYTIVMSKYHTGSIPFKNIMISWHVLSGKWDKISKSKNNAWKTPEELINVYGADAVRYWACGWTLWKNINFDEDEIKKWKKLVTKLWNASKFAIMNLDNYEPNNNLDINSLEDIDVWILWRAKETSAKISSYLESFEFWLARIAFEKFFWKDFCDNYLEIIKNIIYKSDRFGKDKKISAQNALYYTLSAILKMIAPFMPHITEEIYQNYFRQYEGNPSIHNLSYNFPIDIDKEIFDNAERWMKHLLKIVESVRKYKTENGIRMGQEVSKIIITVPKDIMTVIKTHKDNILSVAKSKDIDLLLWDTLSVVINE